MHSTLHGSLSDSANSSRPFPLLTIEICATAFSSLGSEGRTMSVFHIVSTLHLQWASSAYFPPAVYDIIIAESPCILGQRNSLSFMSGRHFPLYLSSQRRDKILPTRSAISKDVLSSGTIIVGEPGCYWSRGHGGCLCITSVGRRYVRSLPVMMYICSWDDTTYSIDTDCSQLLASPGTQVPSEWLNRISVVLPVSHNPL